MSEESKDIIIAEDNTPATFNPARALPIAGAAVLLWAGKKAVELIRARQENPQLPDGRGEIIQIEDEPETDPATDGVIVRYRVEWSIQIQRRSKND